MSTKSYQPTHLKAALQPAVTRSTLSTPAPPPYTLHNATIPISTQIKMDPTPDVSPATPQRPALELSNRRYSPFPSSPASSYNGDREDHDSSEDGSSSITISITAPLHIKGSNNLLAFNPTSHATAIAHSVIQALKEASMSHAGIPMIDEDGRPRTLDVNVDAGIKVEGERNVVGEKAVADILGGRRLSGVDELNGSKSGVHLREENLKRTAGDESEADEGAKRIRVV